MTERDAVAENGRWLAARSEAEVRRALRLVFPDIAEGEIELWPWHDNAAPWHRASALVQGSWVVKFAWSEPAAAKLEWEIAVLVALQGSSSSLARRLAASSSTPVIFVAPFVPGEPLTGQMLDRMSTQARRAIAADLASFLAVLHDASTAERLGGRVFELGAPVPQATTDELRARLCPRLDARRRSLVECWCDWADGVLADGVDPVTVHGDFHGFNVVVDAGRVRCVLDLEECAFGDFHYDFRYLPADDPSLVLLDDVIETYERSTGRRVSLARVMAWHVRTALGDASWRLDAGIALPDGRIVEEWVDDLNARFATLGISPVTK